MPNHESFTSLLLSLFSEGRLGGNLINVQNTCLGRKYQVAREIFNLMETGITIPAVKKLRLEDADGY